MTNSASPLTCSRCGAPIAPGAHFCASCGLDISAPQGGVTTMHVGSPIVAPRRDIMLQALREATLGEYDLLGELGRGGMATVYLAHDIALDRKVAIKVMSPSLFSGEGMAERFKREARTAGQLSHPHIIPIYAVKEHGELLYFVMKYVDGRPLDSIIREVGPLPIPMVQTILQQVGSALGYAHRRGVIHRDIKPANVMLDADGWAIVTDFGIAKVSESQGLTVTGATVGTPSYMSPEQCAAKELTGASDQYSLGVVAYEMLSGKLPFVAESVMAVMYAHFNEPPPPVSQARPDCPPGLSSAVMRMLEKDPEHRFPNMEAATAAAGAVALAADDPVRTQMMTLAAAGPNRQLIERFSTPISDPSAMRSGQGGSGTRPSIGTLTISPGRITIAVGESVQLRTSAKSRRGQAIGQRSVSWASTSTDIARVTPTGLLTAVAPGTVTITASSENTSATATVVVVAGRPARRRGLLIGSGTALAVAAVLFWHFVLRGSPVGSATPAIDSSRLAARPGHDSQPVSTVPLGAVPPAGSTTVSGRDTARARPVDRRAAPTPPVARDSSESTVATALASAQSARTQAVDAGAGPGDLAAGDAAVRQGTAARQEGRRAVAFEYLRSAAHLFAQAESTAAAAARLAAQRRPPPVDTAPKPTPVTTPPAPPVDPLPEIRRTIGDYAHALESRDPGAIARVFPDISRDQMERWRQFFQGAVDIQATWSATRIDPAGDQADARVAMTLSFKRADNHSPDRQSFEVTMLLSRRPSGWVITAIR